MAQETLNVAGGGAVHEGSRAVYYRIRLQESGKTVLLKSRGRGYPDVSEIVRLRHEVKLLERLQGPGFPRCLGVREDPGDVALIFEEAGPLEFLSGAVPMARERVIEIAVQLCDVLGAMHAAGVIHKDICPANIAWSREPLQVLLFGFDLATELPSERTEVRAAEALEGTLPYMSPEQTGRMNRAIDYRTDYYSLGATLYELLTGSPPFAARDAAGMVHAHISKQPPPLHCGGVPVSRALARVVLKLLAKAAEDRYQSAGGLKHDLNRCLEEPEADFTLGTRDVSSRFRIPQKLYGREKEVAVLLDAFQAAGAGRSQLVMVEGYSGIGKSALVHELQKALAASRGFFVSGKFDQFRRDIPFSALAQALGRLLKSVLTRSEAEMAEWKARLVAALGKDAGALEDLLPDLPLVIGASPRPESIEPHLAQARFHRLFEGFVGSFASPGAPLVLFLDDLQWVDDSTLSLLKTLLSGTRLQGLLVIGSYRDNEVDAHHPLRLALGELQRDGVPARTVRLGPLAEADVLHLLSESLHRAEEEVHELARLVLDKTGGNPFFVSQFLEELARAKLIFFSVADNRWSWESDKIRSTEITENVLDLMVGNLRRLPARTQEMIQLAACIGNQFDAEMLSLLSGKSLGETARELWPAVEEGLLVPMDEGIRFLAGASDAEAGGSAFSSAAVFFHDRLQQAAHSLVEEEKRQRIHLTIGRLLLRNASPERKREKLFDIVSHLNQARRLLEPGEELMELLRLNLEAGERARSSGAFGSMADFMNVAIECMGRFPVKEHRETAERVYLGGAEARYLIGDHTAVFQLLEEAGRHIQDLLGEARAAKIRIRAYLAQRRSLEAVQEGLRILGRLGIRLSIDAGEGTVIRTFLRSRLRLALTDLNGIKDRPLLNDPVKLAALDLCLFLCPVTANTRPFLFPLLVFQMVFSLLKDGISSVGVVGLAGYAIILAKIGDYGFSRKLGELSLPLVDRYARPDNAVFARSGLAYFTYWLWKPMGDVARVHLEQVAPAAYAAGNLELTIYSLGIAVAQEFLSGAPLAAQSPRLEENEAQIARYGHELSYGQFRPVAQLVECLQSPGWDGSLLTGRRYDENQGLAKFVEENELSGIFYGNTCAAYVDALFGRPEAGVPKLAQGEATLAAIPSTPLHPLFYFVQSLALTARYRASRDGAALRKARKSLKRLRVWGKWAPFNFLQLAELAEAEIWSALGKPARAEPFYERAVAQALKNGHDRDAGLASELFATRLLEQGRREEARHRIRQAHLHFGRWGALAKTADLERRFPEDFAGSPSSAAPSASNQIDLESVMKASGIIAGEIQLEKLLSRMMSVVAENAGADKAVMILSAAGTDGQPALSVQATWLEGKDARVMQAEPLDSAELSPALVRYVARSRQPVVLGDAAGSGDFVNDLYVLKRRPRSVLGMPVLNQGNLVGVLYLENSQARDAFTPSRLEVLRMLCAQIAVSLENALLYASLERKVQERTSELQATVQQLGEEKARILELHGQLDEQRAKTAQNAKLAALGEMAGGVAHEINTPLAIIRLNTEQLQDVLGDEVIDRGMTADLTGTIKKTVDRIATIVKGLRSFSRDAEEDPFIRVQVVELVNDTLALCQEKFRQHGVAIEVGEIPADLCVSCRPAQLSQVLLNLLNNSFDAIVTGSGSKWVRIGLEHDDGMALLSLTDNGPGIPAEVQARLFQPFFTTKEIGKGTGLGLSISRGIIEAHRGTLTLDTAAENTRFVIALPQAELS